MKSWKLLLSAGLSILVAACGSIARGTQQEVVIETIPAGADVLLSDGQRCTSPCRITAPRYQGLTAHLSRPDCRPAEARLTPSVVEDITLFGSIYDFQLGGAYDLEPNPLSVTLICGEAAKRMVPGLTPEDEALLATFGKPAKVAGQAEPRAALAPRRGV